MCYIGKTKRKIKKRITEHERNIRLSKGNTAIAQLNQKESIKVDLINSPKIANYINENLALKREAIEILSCEKACNTHEHASIEKGWLHRRHD